MKCHEQRSAVLHGVPARHRAASLKLEKAHFAA